MVVAERRKLVTPAQSSGFLESLREFQVLTEHIAKERTFMEILETARRYRLSVYDASYLNLAMREALPLATVDGALRAAARAAGLQLA